jgi:hypothetical protein
VVGLLQGPTVIQVRMMMPVSQHFLDVFIEDDDFKSNVPDDMHGSRTDFDCLLWPLKAITVQAAVMAVTNSREYGDSRSLMGAPAGVPDKRFGEG